MGLDGPGGAEGSADPVARMPARTAVSRSTTSSQGPAGFTSPILGGSRLGHDEAPPTTHADGA